jgi:hypothetical protein
MVPNCLGGATSKSAKIICAFWTSFFSAFGFHKIYAAGLFDLFD